MQKKELIDGLVKIGLNEKEARVYLAALELGEATAQHIAAKATVNRPSTYIAIESLIQRGLMSSFQKGKKRYFAAGKPQKLAYVIEQARLAIIEKEKTTNELVRYLDSQLESISDEFSVTSFEGSEGLMMWQNDVLNSDVDSIYEILDLDASRQYLPALSKEDIRQRIREKYRNKIRTIYVSKRNPGEIPVGKDVTRIDKAKFPFQDEIFIYGDTTVFYKYGAVSKGIMIKCKSLAENMKLMFRMVKKIAQ